MNNKIYQEINRKVKFMNLPLWLIISYLCFSILIILPTTLISNNIYVFTGVIFFVSFVAAAIVIGGLFGGVHFYDNFKFIFQTKPLFVDYFTYTKRLSADPQLTKILEKERDKEQETSLSGGKKYYRNEGFATINTYAGKKILKKFKNIYNLQDLKEDMIKNKLASNKGSWLTQSQLGEIPFGGIFYDQERDLNFIYNEDHTISTVLELEGLSYIGKTAEQIIHDFDERSILLQYNLEANFTISFFTLRKRVYVDDYQNDPLLKDKEDLYYSSAYCENIDKIWNKSFKGYFVNKHYIMLTFSGLNAPAVISTKLFSKSIDDGVIKLAKIKNDIKQRFAAYKAKDLSDTEIGGFLLSVMYGEDDFPKYNFSINPGMHGFMSDYSINTKEGYIEFHDKTKDKFAACIDIIEYGDKLDFNMMTEILAMPFKILWASHVDYIPPKAVTNKLTKGISFFNYFSQRTATYTDLLAGKYNVTGQLIESGDIYPVASSFILMVYADSKQGLIESADKLINVFQSKGHKANRATDLLNACYQSIFPSRKRYNPHSVILTADNISTLFHLGKTCDSLEENAWGKNSVQKFLTVDTISPFYFNFHENSSADAKGHTLLVGGSSSGKTTFAQFLILGAMKYKNMKVIMFDSLQGLKVFTRFAEGNYIEFNGSNGFNPVYLSSFGKKVSELTSIEKDELENDINHVCWFVNKLLESDRAEENHINKTLKSWLTEGQHSLDEIRLDLPLISQMAQRTSHPEIKRRFDDLLGNNRIKNLFVPDGKESKIVNFNNPLTTFDITAIKSDQKLIALVADHILHEINKSKDPGLIFFDEMPTYLDSKVFKEQIAFLLSQARKKNKVIVSAVQDLTQITRHADFADQIFTNYAKIIFLPPITSSSQVQEFMQDKLGMNIEQIEWLSKHRDRQALIKNMTDGSINIVHNNFSHLGQGIMSTFSSSQNNVRLLDNLIEICNRKYKDKDALMEAKSLYYDLHQGTGSNFDIPSDKKNLEAIVEALFN